MQIQDRVILIQQRQPLDNTDTSENFNIQIIRVIMVDHMYAGKQKCGICGHRRLILISYCIHAIWLASSFLPDYKNFIDCSQPSL